MPSGHLTLASNIKKMNHLDISRPCSIINYIKFLQATGYFLLGSGSICAALGGPWHNGSHACEIQIDETSGVASHGYLVAEGSACGKPSRLGAPKFLSKSLDRVSLCLNPTNGYNWWKLTSDCFRLTGLLDFYSRICWANVNQSSKREKIYCLHFQSDVDLSVGLQGTS